jgi:hypothetical protein
VVLPLLLPSPLESEDDLDELSLVDLAAVSDLESPEDLESLVDFESEEDESSLEPFLVSAGALGRP